MNRRRRAQLVYRALLRLYPAAHRRAFGEEMVQAFGDHYRDAVEGRGGSRLRFWLAVLADAASSLRTEHAAERAARRARRRAARRRFRFARRGSGRRLGLRRRFGPRRGGAVGIARRPRVRRCRPSRSRPVRVLIRTRHHQVVYRGRIALVAVLLPLVAAALGAGLVTERIGLSLLATGVLVAAWLAYGLRLARRVPAGPRGDGPTPPGGAGVREPRRPLPLSPAGAAARPMPDRDPPGQAAAAI